MNPTSSPQSAIARLLHELSWEGNARHYRQGGAGRENVLTVEVFQALDFLPRSPFLENVLLAAAGGAAATLNVLQQELETFQITLLPGDIFLAKDTDFKVQPDAVFETTSVYGLLEVKRLKPGSFQPEQLAREYVAVLQEAQARNKRPLLLLLLPKEPPINVKRLGPMAIADAVAHPLDRVLKRCVQSFGTPEQLCAGVENTVAYVTWPALKAAVVSGRSRFDSPDLSVRAAVMRLSDAVLHAIQRHDKTGS